MLYLLMVLTQNGAGDINASFVNTLTLEQCQEKTLMVEAVFNTADIPVIEHRCIKSKLEFSEFGHAVSSSQINYFYLIHMDELAVQIKKIPDWSTCMMQARQSVEAGKTYCSSSAQFLEN